MFSFEINIEDGEKLKPVLYKDLQLLHLFHTLPYICHIIQEL